MKISSLLRSPLNMAGGIPFIPFWGVDVEVVDSEVGMVSGSGSVSKSCSFWTAALPVLVSSSGFVSVWTATLPSSGFVSRGLRGVNGEGVLTMLRYLREV